MPARKRGNAEGSIYRMQDGRWRAAITTGWRVTPDGKRKPERKVFTAATRHEVSELLTADLRDRDHGLPIKANKLTVGQYLNSWLRIQSSRPLDPKRTGHTNK